MRADEQMSAAAGREAAAVRPGRSSGVLRFSGQKGADSVIVTQLVSSFLLGIEPQH